MRGFEENISKKLSWYFAYTLTNCYMRINYVIHVNKTLVKNSNDHKK